MPTSQQDIDFASRMEKETKVNLIISSDALDIATAWISNHLNPEDVFSDKDLSAWAESNGYVKE